MSADKPKDLRCAVMITTHNRLEDLKRTCYQLKKLDPSPDEWLFTADGCSDGTEEWLRTEFAEATVVVNSPGAGSVPSRDRMIRAANSDLILSLDDDSYPLEVNAIHVLKEFFRGHEDVALASLPQRTDEYPETHGQEDFGELRPVGSYSSCAACIRRRAYLETDGYAHCFGHMYEEPDFALQAMAAGWKILWLPEVIIRHHYSPVGRYELAIHHRHSRNEVWSVLMRCPWPWMPLVIVGKAASQARYAARRGPTWLMQEPTWWAAALRGARKALRYRKPIRWADYRNWIRTPK